MIPVVSPKIDYASVNPSARKVVGKAFLNAMADALGHHDVFAELQQDPYWCFSKLPLFFWLR
jgi:hypothetical protein